MTLKKYTGMEYVCEDCGKVETFDGLAVKTRSPFGDEDEECAIHMMNLQNAEAYWNDEIEPDTIWHPPGLEPTAEKEGS